MSIVELLSRLRLTGVKLWLEKDALKYQAPKGALSSEMLKEISDRKSEIISFLRQIKNDNEAAKSSIPRIARSDGQELPLSFSQQSMWFYDSLTQGNPVFNISNAVRMNGVLNKGIFKNALKTLIMRYESMRTTFKNKNGKPVQIIHNTMDVNLPEIDISSYPKDEMEEQLKGLLKKEARQIFNLETGPLFRFNLFILGKEEYVFSMTIHHIISDAWSNAIFVGEFFRLYEAELKGQNLTLPDLAIQYADYADWERKRLVGETLEDLLGYWKKQLDKPVTLQMPLDFPRPKSQTYEGDFESFNISQDITEKLKLICTKEGVSMFMVILAAFQTLLYRYTRQNDIFTGTVVANRNRKEVENVVGFFMNTLVLRTNFDGDPSFIDVLDRVKQMTLDAYTYQELPFDKLLEELRPERDISRTPLFQLMFILHNTQKVALELPGLKMLQIDVQSDMAPFDLRLQLTETNNGIKGGFDYSAAIFKRSTIIHMGLHLLNILKCITEDTNVKVADINMLSEAEQNQILYQFNNTDAEFPDNKVIYEFIEDQASAYPNRIAAQFNDSVITYGDLNKKTNCLARVLREKGVGRDSIVGVMLERSLDMITSVIAIQKAGGAYLPMDPKYPADRISYILQDSETHLLLTKKEYCTFNSGDTTILDVDDKCLYLGDASNIEKINTSVDLAYVIYTSGSTGKPKGTLLQHNSLVNRLNWMQKKYPIGCNDVILQKTPFTFDVSVWELFWWSMQGARVCFLEPGFEKDPSKIVSSIEKNNVTIIHFVPSMLNSFLEYLKESGGVERVKSLRQVFASGEALTAQQVLLFKELLSETGTLLANLYGPTEATIDVSYFDCITPEDLDNIPIGKPIDNTKLLIMDKKMHLQPVGVPGELCISGVGLARGYLNRPELTSEKFIDNPYELGKKLYRTGDLAKWGEDGNIQYLGRIDLQIKIRGLRIELEEIEKALLNHPSIKNCIVSTWEKQPGNTLLIGYVVCEKDQMVESAELEEFLAKNLPDYMVPKIYVYLDDIPVSTNGKADRKSLPAPSFEKKPGYVAPSNETEKVISDIWKEELGLTEISVSDNFFEVGGHSLLLARIHNRLEKQFNKEFSLIDLFTHSTIRSLSGYVSRENSEPLLQKDEDRLCKQKEARLLKRQMHRQFKQ